MATIALSKGLFKLMGEGEKSLCIIKAEGKPKSNPDLFGHYDRRLSQNPVPLIRFVRHE